MSAEPFWRTVKGKCWIGASSPIHSLFAFDVRPETTLTQFSNFQLLFRRFHRFAINLTLGHLHNDIALHINPRIPQNYIVRNSKINGRWGKEETTASLPFKLKRDERFAIQILVTESTYLISVNGLHFTTFAHRVPFDRVTCVQLVGDVIEGDIQHLPIKVNIKWFNDFYC